MTQNKKIRYAVVGAGWISQAAFMPGVKHTGNSEMTALVTGDEKKAKVLSQKYGIKRAYGYDQYDEMLRSGEVDAVYLALPNDLHREYAVRTLEAGIHLLLEKPMAVTELECQDIIDAAERTGAKLMIAYRLHFEPGTLRAIDLVRSGKIGEPKFFSSVFCQSVSGENHRADPKHWAGPLSDMGPYPINAVRNLFGSEPTELFAIQSEQSPTDLLITVVLRFSGNRQAQFTVGFGESGVDEYRIVGTRGSIELSPGFGFAQKYKESVTIGEKTERVHVPMTDQFGGELKYFSDCILKGKDPEPDGWEGLADVRIIKAIERSIESGEVQQLGPFEKGARPGLKQVVKLPPVREPRMVDASGPG